MAWQVGKTRLKNISVAIEPVLVAPPKPAEPPPPILQQQQQLRLQQQIKTEPTDLTATAAAAAQSHEDSEKKDSVGGSCVIGGPPPPVESLLAHINSQLETGGGIKAEIDSEFPFKFSFQYAVLSFGVSSLVLHHLAFCHLVCEAGEG